MDEKEIPRLRLANYSVVDREEQTLIPTEDIIVFFEELAEKKEMVYIVDCNGFREGTPHLDLLSEISDLLPVWVEANSRSVEDVSDLLVAGVEKVALDIGELSKEEIEAILEETTNLALILKEPMQMLIGSRLSAIPVVIRTDKIPVERLRNNPVVLDVENLSAEMRGKLNIVGRIVELDLNEL